MLYTVVNFLKSRGRIPLLPKVCINRNIRLDKLKKIL